MARSASLSSAIAGRYGQAVFDIANADGTLPQLATEVAALTETLESSPDLRGVLGSAVVPRDEQAGVVRAVAERLGVGATLANTLGLMAQKGRLFALPALLSQLDRLLADARGEVTAEVASAQPLTDEQADRLTRILSEKSGKTVKLATRVDAGLIGGMVVKLGSRMIDSSIRSKLDSLQTTMREAR